MHRAPLGQAAEHSQITAFVLAFLGMGRHPQLRVFEAPMADFSAAHFFDVTLRELLTSHRDAARAVGGRFGFVVGAIERVVDLDNGRVHGDAMASAVQDDDRLDATLALTDDDFARAVRGTAMNDAQAHEAYPGALLPLLRFLAGALR